MIRLALFLIGLALMGYTSLSVLDPERQPAGIVGLNPSFDEIDDLYDAALEDGQPDEAQAWVDEFLLSAGGGSFHARRAWDLRDAARLQGASFHGVPSDRGQAWRLGRVLERRPSWETGLAMLGSVLVTGVLLAMLFLRGAAEREDDARFQPPSEHVDRVYGED